MRYLPALVLDAVLVLVFAVTGRASHDEDPLGFLQTVWPFLVALLVGHLVAALLPSRPRRLWSPVWGAVVWLVTVTGGLLLRVATGDTAQLPFIIVATLVLGVFLVGWRIAAAIVRQRGARATGDAEAAPAEDSEDGSADSVAVDSGHEPADRTEPADGHEPADGTERAGGTVPVDESELPAPSPVDESHERPQS